MAEKKLGEERVCSSLQNLSRNLASKKKKIRAGTQGRDLEAGVDIETLEEYCLLARSS